MRLFQNLRRYLAFSVKEETPAPMAYDLWAGQYDNQPDNLMLVLDEQLVSAFIGKIPIESRIIADIGCGTGRHWQKIMDRGPARLVGYDVSANMLRRLHEKFPQAATQLIQENNFDFLPDNAFDLLLSTLTIAHIRDLGPALSNWSRSMRPGADLLITDFHPKALAKGAKRCFLAGGQQVTILNFVHPIEHIEKICKSLQLKMIRKEEICTDELVKSFYEKQNALELYNDYYGTPIIYALHLKKSYAVN